MMYVVRSFKFIIASFAVVTLASCSPKQGSTSSIQIVLPSSSTLNKDKAFSQSVSAMAFDSTLDCFAVNITGPAIPQSANSCSPAVGVFSGFKVGGTAVELLVPTGSNRKLEIFYFKRALTTDACPANFAAITPDKVASIGVKAGIEMNQPQTRVEITVTAPAGTDNLITQNVVSASCVAIAPTPTPVGPSSGRVSYGNQLQISVGGYKASVRVKHQQGLGQVTTGGGYKAEIGPPVVQ